MLVFAKDEGKILYLPNNIRVYGTLLGMPATDVPYDIYQVYKEALIDATYRSKDLQRLFGKPFSDFVFTIPELKHMPYFRLKKLAFELGVLKMSRLTRGQLIRAVRNAFRYGSSNCQTCGKKFILGHRLQKYCTNSCRKYDT